MTQNVSDIEISHTDKCLFQHGMSQENNIEEFIFVLCLGRISEKYLFGIQRIKCKNLVLNEKLIHTFFTVVFH